MKVVFLGTPLIAVPSLQYLIKQSDVEVLAVVTQPDKPSGRGQCLTCSSVKCVALEENISIFQPTSIRKDSELIQKLKELAPDFFITFAFGQILSQEVLNIPKIGTINLHASLLPKYRGANPIQAPIINGDKFTGITTMLTDIGIDTGDILLQKVIEITENMTTPELTQIISQESPELIYETIKGLFEGSIKPIPQNHEESTHAPKVNKDDGIINWSESALQIHNKVRGLKPWPSTYTYINGICIKITETRICKENIKSEHFGEIVGKMKSGINVQTGDGIITITKVQPACKKEMDALSWYNGARLPKRSFFKSVCETEEECNYDSKCSISENKNG
jgi:methionyl-tRNA formyltransferase